MTFRYILNDTLASVLIILGIALGFLMGVLLERQNSEDKIYKMQFECYKRKMGDFYYIDENGSIEFKWRTN